MNIKQIVGLIDRITQQESVGAALSNKELIDEISETGEYISGTAEQTKELLIKRISESDLSKLILMCQKCAVADSLSNGDFGIAVADMSSDLRVYTNTVVMSVIGILYEEGIL